MTLKLIDTRHQTYCSMMIGVTIVIIVVIIVMIGVMIVIIVVIVVKIKVMIVHGLNANY